MKKTYPIKPVRSIISYNFECYCGHFNNIDYIIGGIIECQDCGMIMSADIVPFNRKYL